MKFASLTLLALLTSANAFCDDNAWLSSRYRAPALTFDLAITNPSTKTPRHITSVGVESKVNGTFSCVGSSNFLLPTAKLVVPFSVAVPETEITDMPTLRLGPGQSIKVSVGLYPDESGACGPWISHVRVFVVFDNKLRLYSAPSDLSHDDVRKVEIESPTRQRIFAALRHQQPIVRTASLAKLKDSRLDKASIEFCVRRAMRDPDESVRIAAIRLVPELSLNALAGDMSKRLSSSSDHEKAALCHALSTLRFRPAEPQIAELLLSGRVTDILELTEDLKRFGDPSISEILRPHLPSLQAWSAIDQKGDAASLVTRAITQLLFYYRDQGSVGSFGKVLTGAGNPRLKEFVLSELSLLTPSQKLVTDPFLLAFRDDLSKLVRSDDAAALRSSALALLFQQAASDRDRESWIQAGLQDKNPSLRASACTLASEVHSTALLAPLQQAIGTMPPQSPALTACCNAVKGLGATCQNP